MNHLADMLVKRTKYHEKDRKEKIDNWFDGNNTYRSIIRKKKEQEGFVASRLRGEAQS